MSVNPDSPFMLYKRNFSSTYLHDPDSALAQLTALVAYCFADMKIHHRMQFYYTIGPLLKKIGIETFEDPTDLCNLLMEGVDELEAKYKSDLKGENNG